MALLLQWRTSWSVLIGTWGKTWWSGTWWFRGCYVFVSRCIIRHDHHSNKNKLCISQKFRRVLLSLHDFSKRDISTDDFLLQDFYLRPTVTDKRTFYVENVRFIHFLNLCCFLCILPLLRLYEHQKFIDAKCQYWQYFQFFAVNESNKTAVWSSLA